MTLPNFLGLGAPKSATTWLFYCLAEHPEIFVADSKEVMFFDYENIKDRLGTYQTHFSRAGNAKAIGEFSTRYLASTRAPKRVKLLMPNAKLIVSLRQPAEQVYSHYWHLRRQNFHALGALQRVPSFEEALEEMEDRLLTPAYYFKNLSNWLEHFDFSRIHVILYDDIVSEPARVVGRLYSFLGVDDGFIPSTLDPDPMKIRKGRAPGSAFKERLHRHVYSLLVRGVYRPLKSYVGVRRADKIKTSLRIREAMDYIFHDVDYPCMSFEVRTALSRRFDSDVQRLSTLLDRPLEHWLSHSPERKSVSQPRQN